MMPDERVKVNVFELPKQTAPAPEIVPAIGFKIVTAILSV